MKKRLVPIGLGALGMYFFDPQLGRTRRAKLMDQLGGFSRRTAHEVERKTEYMKGQVEGIRHQVTSGSDSPPPNDETLTAKIQSEVLSRWNYPKGSINVNTAEGVVELRGSCETRDQINELEQEVRKISGVIDVHNFLHLPGERAPNKK
jgi:osmotically-inducible protein OsmY